jgi:hypothetical protein
MSPYFLSVMLGGGGGGENPNVILIRNVAIILGSMRHHFRILKIALLFHTIQNKYNLRRNIHSIMMHTCI